MVKLSLSSMSCVYGIMAMFMTVAIESASFGEVIEDAMKSETGREKRGARGRNNNGYRSSNRASRLCPSVICDEVSPSCRNREFIVYEFYVQQPNGRRVNVRCESCPYCLDYPGSWRNKRSLSRVHSRRLSQNDEMTDCSGLKCPEIRNDCLNVQLAEVILRNKRCRECPACFDDTIFGR